MTLLVDETTPHADLYAGIIAVGPGTEVPVHWHRTGGELMIVIAGTGVLLSAGGMEQRVAPHDAVYAPLGRGASHGFRNDGALPLMLAFVHASPSGRRPVVNAAKLDIPGNAPADATAVQRGES